MCFWNRKLFGFCVEGEFRGEEKNTQIYLLFWKIHKRYHERFWSPSHTPGNVYYRSSILASLFCSKEDPFVEDRTSNSAAKNGRNILNGLKRRKEGSWETNFCRQCIQIFTWWTVIMISGLKVKQYNHTKKSDRKVKNREVSKTQ